MVRLILPQAFEGVFWPGDSSARQEGDKFSIVRGKMKRNVKKYEGRSEKGIEMPQNNCGRLLSS
jgi:hypothetical protein